MFVRYLVLGCVLTLWVVFLVSAASKLGGRSAYSQFVRATEQLLPPGAPGASVVAAVVVAAEAAAVILLPVLPVVGLLLAAALLLAFGAAVLAAVARGVKAPSRCFGASVRPLGRSHAVRNGALGLPALVAAVGAATAPVSGGTGLVANLHPGGVGVAVFGALVLAVLTISFDDVADLFSDRSTPVGAGRATERI
jgi:hypothetical protein